MSLEEHSVKVKPNMDNYMRAKCDAFLQSLESKLMAQVSNMINSVKSEMYAEISDAANMIVSQSCNSQRHVSQGNKFGIPLFLNVFSIFPHLRWRYTCY